MNLIDLTDKHRRAVCKRAFRIWQHTPYQVAKLSDDEHTCNSCGTIYQGNFCPRCGQASRVGRFSFKVAFLLFLDIWGIGNRGMFRSIRDLMLRPGYMIRDYVGGKQSAYFPPFKMFFVLATFSLLITHGLSLQEEKQTVSEVKEELHNEVIVNGKEVHDDVLKHVNTLSYYFKLLEKKSPSLFSLLMLIIISAPLYLFFRHCPAVPDLRYPEHVIALVYTSNMYTLYRMLSDVIPFRFLSDVMELVAVIMIFVALKQFTGYSKRKLLWYMALTLLIFFVSLIAIVTLLVLIAKVF